MLTQKEASVLADYKNAATLNREQIADYISLLEKSQIVPEVEAVAPAKVKKGKK
jgi:hypothetical protein